MRCPECDQRNSVAARKCKFCGARFKRKQMSRGAKITLALFSIIVGGSLYLLFALPKMVDPTEQLLSAAKRVAAGPRSPEDAKTIKAAFNEAVTNLLLKYGGENSSSLSSRLKNCLPSNAFEVLVADLPKGLKLVEVDTVLQASDFLIMRGTNMVKVFPLTGFEIFDDARAVSDQAGAVIVLLGHSGGQPPHRPIVQTYALLPDSIIDETANMVPSIAGEGSAKFSKDSSDVNVELSAASIAQAEKISMNPPLVGDRVLRMKLQWKDAKYVPSIEMPADLPTSVLLLARSLKRTELANAVAAQMGSQASKLLKENSSPDLQEISVQKKEEKRKSIVYSISIPKKKIDLELKSDGTRWQVASYSVSADAAIKSIAESNSGANSKNSATSIETSAATPTGTSITNDVLAGLTPERAGGRKPADVVVTGTGNASSSPSLPESKTSAAKGSNWIDDEPGSTNKPPVAVLPPGLKNASVAEKERSEKEKKENERREKEKAERDKAEKDRIEREKKAAEQAAVSSARIVEGGSSTVRLRSGPGLGNRAIDEIPAGAKIQILGQKKGWYKVAFGGKVGYVFSPLVDTSNSNRSTNDSKASKPLHESSKPVTAQPPSSSSGAVVVRVMTVRDENRRAISSVKVGEQVVLLSGLNKNNRYKIRKPDGTVGYVHKDALDVKVETPPEFVP